MKHYAHSNNTFSRYDLFIEVNRENAHEISSDRQLQKMADCLITGNEEELEGIVKKAWLTKEPMDVINLGLIPGMKEVSRLWEAGVYFLPQVILSSDAMIAGIKLCEEEMGKTLEKKAGIITHTAEGDIHDIDQVIVNALLNVEGFEVINLGADVPVEEVVENCQVCKPVMLTGIALMTTTMTAFPKIAAKLRQLNLSIPFVCGGGTVTEEFATRFDLGIFDKEASQASRMAEDALKGLNWIEMRAKWNG